MAQLNRITKLTSRQEAAARDIFETVYQWGRVGVVIDANAPGYRRLIEKLLYDLK